LGIILFGSAAAGDMTRNSDIDLLVVLEQRPKNSLEAHGRIHRTLRGLGYAFGVFRISRKEFEETKEIFGGIAYPAQRFGRVIHGTA
jgi:predicted nucleotidyltransferase